MDKEDLIKNSKYPVLARIVVDTTLKLEEENRLGIHKRLATTLPRCSRKRIQGVVDNTIEEVMYSVVGDSYETLADKSLQQGMKTYLHSNIMV